ncbi:acyl-CoA carboxylase epsilon subunit [Nonomuraea jiangxiensis]|uniref:acyl-CoA carboxylase epsilon subunit n=1 Tax=Nonomuraea jiangxiensis TaxID=633440 RepID=UPI0015A1E33D|nr:acyl-CoA carboxylase epsilon subunit [Nonomuraea jiangxiensis]
MALLIVERGAPTAEELAALTAVVAARLQSRARLVRPEPPASGQAHPGHRSGSGRQGGRRLAPWVVRAGAVSPRPAPSAL